MASMDADSSSEEESLSVIKRKVDEDKDSSHKRSKYCDEDAVIPEVLVRVEIEEMDESAYPINYSMNKDPLASTSKPKKTNRRYPCNQCNSAFQSMTELRGHSLQHQVETRHKCEFCGRCFNKAFSLKLHKKAHEDKELKCPFCDLAFTQEIHLGRHMMAHPKNEECSQCLEKFHTADQLKHHQQIHDGTVKKKSKGKRKRKTDSVFEKPVNDVANVKTEMNVEDNNRTDIFNEYDNCLKREDLDHDTQCAIVSKMHKGRSIGDICKLYNVTPEVVNEIWEDRAAYKIPKKTGEKTNRYLNGVLDTRLLEWFNVQRDSEVQVTGKMLQDVAEAIAKEIGFVAFNGSKKWLDRFKTRYKITLRLHQVKRDSPSAAFDSKWKKAFFNEQWCDVRLGFTDDNIYTADEVGVYYNPSKGRIKKQFSKKFVHGSVKDRLSILMCTNVTGTDKKKLLVCGIEDPLIHSHRDPDTLPVNYIRHSQGYFTTQMFEEYVTRWNNELLNSKKTALLIIDRATIHTKMQLSNLKLCFVPWKASVGLMPIRNGIYSKFRDEFRKQLLEEKASNVLSGADRNLTCIEALYMLDKAWERTPSDVIGNSFKVTGYDVGSYSQEAVFTAKVKENDEEEICEMLKDFDVEPYFTNLANLDMYLTVDEELLTGQGTNCSVFGGNHKVPLVVDKESEEVLPIGTEKPETDEKESVVKRNRAVEDLEIVRKYLLTNKTSYETYCHLMEIEKFLYKTPFNIES